MKQKTIFQKDYAAQGALPLENVGTALVAAASIAICVLVLVHRVG